MEEAIFRIAAQVSTPIGLAALVIAVLFGLYRGVLKQRVFSPLGRDLTHRLLSLLLWLVFSLAVITLILWFVGTALHPQSSNGPQQVAADPADTQIAIDFREAPLREILLACAKQAGAALATDRGIGGKLSIHTDGKRRLAEVMNQICEVVGCTWEVHAGHPPVLFVNSKGNAPN
jgi:hypothetical protein